MNVLTAIATTPEIEWIAARNSVNAWRGKCLHAFGHAEFAISEALAACAGDPARGAMIVLPHLLGQRIESLAAAIAGTGPFAVEGAQAIRALASFRRHETHRAPLAHGCGKITLDRQGQWTLVMRMITFRSGLAERSATVWEQGEATAFCATLVGDAQRLCGKLGQLRQSLTAV